MKEQHESLVKDKERLKVELEAVTQRFVNIQARIDELKDENEERLGFAIVVVPWSNSPWLLTPDILSLKWAITAS